MPDRAGPDRAAHPMLQGAEASASSAEYGAAEEDPQRIRRR